jgi:hypothetical protein
MSGYWKLKWKTWALCRVRFFVWLACQDRCLTHERLSWRCLPHPRRCLLCDQSVEIMVHILMGCPFSRTTLHEVMSWIRYTPRPLVVEGDFANWWSWALWASPFSMCKGTSSLTMLTVWWIFKHRNKAIFDNAQPLVSSLIDMIKAEARLWISMGAKGVS